MDNGTFINARISTCEALKYEEMTPLQKAKADMDYMRHFGGFGYKQAKRHYEKLLRKEQKTADQLDLFAASYDKPALPKHIRLIEFFAGIGAQAKALEILNADFEHWRTCEWSWQSIIAYNAIHMGGKIADTSDLTYEEVLDKIRGVSHDYNQPMTDKQLKARGEKWARRVLGAMMSNNNVCPDVSQLKGSDLGITERESNTYILTYSFPCQDLSNAGLMKGMEVGTRSGLLWEVERILKECQELGELPQVLVMENVPGVIGTNQIDPFNRWLDALSKMGYSNYYKILNAKDYGIPQNRRRCFMISILGDYSFHFPKKVKLRYLIKDFIERKVDEKYYLPDELVEKFRREGDPT
jgi:DNA (cytosine-5)-methyltransferase 1